MDTWQIFALVVGVVAIWALRNAFSAYGRFWRLVGRHPDLALKLFSIERDCAVDTVPANKGDYVGPFQLMDTSGRRHTVYILNNSIETIQARITADIGQLTG